MRRRWLWFMLACQSGLAPAGHTAFLCFPFIAIWSICRPISPPGLSHAVLYFLLFPDAMPVELYLSSLGFPTYRSSVSPATSISPHVSMSGICSYIVDAFRFPSQSRQPWRLVLLFYRFVYLRRSRFCVPCFLLFGRSRPRAKLSCAICMSGLAVPLLLPIDYPFLPPCARYAARTSRLCESVSSLSRVLRLPLLRF